MFDRKGVSGEHRIRPLEPKSSPCADCEHCPTVMEFQDHASYPSMTLQVDIGRDFLDGTWHVIWLNLPEIVECAFEQCGGLSAGKKMIGRW